MKRRNRKEPTLTSFNARRTPTCAVLHPYVQHDFRVVRTKGRRVRCQCMDCQTYDRWSPPAPSVVDDTPVLATNDGVCLDCNGRGTRLLEWVEVVKKFPSLKSVVTSDNALNALVACFKCGGTGLCEPGRLSEAEALRVQLRGMSFTALRRWKSEELRDVANVLGIPLQSLKEHWSLRVSKNDIINLIRDVVNADSSGATP